MEHPSDIKVGYCPVLFARTGRASCKIVDINWRMNKKETGGKKVENPGLTKTNDMAELVLMPLTPFCVDVFTNCEGLGRVAGFEGRSVNILGRVVAVSDEVPEKYLPTKKVKNA